jgi:septum formation protein
MSDRRLILASASPRRQEAMHALGYDFQVEVSHVERWLPLGDDPADPVPIAEAKARDVAARHPDAVVLAGDTIVAVDGTALGKPSSPEDAARMLRRLRGQRHVVRTALALCAPPLPGEPLASPPNSPSAGPCALAASAEVVAPLTMREYADDEIAAYVTNGEPMDCAGAYDIHRRGGMLIAAVEGCFSTIVGLPIVAAAALLRQASVAAPRDAAAVCTRLYGRPCLALDPTTAQRCRSVASPDSLE